MTNTDWVCNGLRKSRNCGRWWVHLNLQLRGGGAGGENKWIIIKSHYLFFVLCPLHYLSLPLPKFKPNCILNLLSLTFPLLILPTGDFTSQIDWHHHILFQWFLMVPTLYQTHVAVNHQTEEFNYTVWLDVASLPSFVIDWLFDRSAINTHTGPAGPAAFYQQKLI